MNRTQALTKLKKILGKGLAYREDPLALTAEDREAALADLHVANAANMAAKAACDARRKWLLENDAEYQQLRKASLEASATAERAASLVHRRRVTVGTTNNGLGFFHVRAAGDNWQEVVDKLNG